MKEGTTDDYVNDMWQYLEEALGAETVLDELYRYLYSDTIDGFINHMKRHYEIDESLFLIYLRNDLATLFGLFLMAWLILYMA